MLLLLLLLSLLFFFLLFFFLSLLLLRGACPRGSVAGRGEAAGAPAGVLLRGPRTAKE